MKIETFQLEAVTEGETIWDMGSCISIPKGRYVCAMIPIPEGWRMATEEEQTSLNDFDFMELFEGEWKEEERGCIDLYGIYIVKEEPEVKELTMKQAMKELKEKHGCKIKITE